MQAVPYSADLHGSNLELRIIYPLMKWWILVLTICYVGVGISCSSCEWSECSDDITRSIEGNISLIVNDSESEKCVRSLHSAFFEDDV